MNVKERHTNVTRLPLVSMNVDHIRASVRVGTLKMALNAIMPVPALLSEKIPKVQAEIMSLIQMVREGRHRLQCTAICLPRMELA